MKNLIKILCSTLTVYIFVIFLGAYLTLKCELQDPLANIKNYYDALWWSINATSIGDSNVYPITLSGRIVGMFLIIIGYGLFTINVGTISASLTHLISEHNKNSLINNIERILNIKQKENKNVK